MSEKTAQIQGSFGLDAQESHSGISRHRFTAEDYEKARTPEARQKRRETFRRKRDRRKEGVLQLHVAHEMTAAYIARELGYSEAHITCLIRELRREGRIPEPEKPVLEGKLCSRCNRFHSHDHYVNARGKQTVLCASCRAALGATA